MIYNFVADRLFFNTIIRFLLEGYLEFALDSLINMKSVSLILSYYLVEMGHK